MNAMIRSLAWGCAGLTALACSDFHGVGFSHGTPGSSDTVAIPDTVFLPEDTVLLPGGYASKDTLYDYDFIVRPGRSILLTLRTADYGVLDSLALLASFASDESLNFVFKDSTDQSRTLRSSTTLQGDRIRQDLSVLLRPNGLYTLRWRWPDSATASRMLIALGASEKSKFDYWASHSLYESSSLPSTCANDVLARYSNWCPLPVFAGDRLEISFSGDAVLGAYLFTGAGLEEYLSSQGAVLSSALYNRANNGDSFTLDISTTDTLYWVVANPSVNDLNFTDSLLASQKIVF